LLTVGTRAALYCRLSQDRDGTKKGTDRQEKDCRALAQREGLTVVEVFVDDDRSAYSGKSRPAFDRMMSQLDRFDVLIYWKTDRLCRRINQFFKVLEACEAAEVRLVSVVDPIDTSTAMGQGIAGMLAAVAQQESENTGRRVRRASEDRARNGRPHGHRRAYGYTKDGTELVEAEAKRVREAVERVKQGEAMHSIVQDWNAHGVPATNGGAWTVTPLRQILVSPRIAGLRTHQGEAIGKASWPAIISVEDRDVVQALLDANGRAPHRRPRAGQYLLSGLLHCGRCDAIMHSAFRNDRGDGNDRRYLCHTAPGREACGQMSIAANSVERTISDAVLYLLSSSAAIKRALRPLKKGAHRSPLADVQALEQRVVQLGLDHDEGLISRAEWLERRTPLVERIDAAHREAAAAADAAPLTQFAGADPANLWVNLDLDQQRAVIAALINKISIAPAKTRGRGFDPNRVQVSWRA
jgi:site-specific DNA recombinase